MTASADAARRTTFWPWLVFGAIVVVALAARALTAYRAAGDPPVLAEVPAFELTDQTNAVFRSTTLRDKVWLASFIYTTCPGPCPRVVERIAQVRMQLGDDPRLRIVSFSVDPESDSPDALATYGKLRGIDPHRWHLLTGPTGTVLDLIRKGFFLGVERPTSMPPNGENTDAGPVIHSTRLVLVDGEMRVRGYYETTEPEDMRRLVDHARRLLRSHSS